jgi:hypothetical protein
VAQILHRLGCVRREEVVSVTRDDLVGQYIGHTAPKAKDGIKKAMGGVLFIERRNYLYRPENERDMDTRRLKFCSRSWRMRKTTSWLSSPAIGTAWILSSRAIPVWDHVSHTISIFPMTVPRSCVASQP